MDRYGSTRAFERDNILRLYKRLLNRDRAAHYLKADLHIHSPASRDYIKTQKENSNSIEYELLIKSISENDTSVIAITDHNSFKGYFELQRILGESFKLRSILNGKLILPGIEITCYNKHFLAIFPESSSKEKLNSFIMDCGIDIDEQGNQDASADKVSPLLLCEKVGQHGGIIIIPHCDADHGLLESYFDKKASELDIKGRSIEKILNNKFVLGICYNYSQNLNRLHDVLRNLKIELPVFQASDSHSSLKRYSGSGLPIGTRASWIKIGGLSFKSLYLALQNAESRVLTEAPCQKVNPVILGIAIFEGFIRDSDDKQEWTVIPFSEELNCVVGARGTGKSTLLDILKFVLNPNDTDLGKRIIGRFGSAVAFLQGNGEIFAIAMSPTSVHKLNIKYYEYRDGKFFNLQNSKKLQSSLRHLTNDLALKEFVTMENIQSYSQKELFVLSTTSLGPTMVTESLNILKYRGEYKSSVKAFYKYRDNIKQSCQDLKWERRRDFNADPSSPYLEEQYRLYQEVNKKLSKYHEETIKEINRILKNKLKISFYNLVPEEFYTNLVNDWVTKVRYSRNIIFETQVDLSRLLKNLFKYPNENWGLPFYLFTQNVTALSESCKIDLSTADYLCNILWDKIEPEQVIVMPRMVSDFQLNVNHGISNTIKFKHRSHLSLGQRAVGMLLLILHAATELGEDRPLLIDQPEDDLDNIYIYHTLVKEFQRLKKVRQLIIATHNPNIPIAGDAENILVLDSDGDFGWVNYWGSIDRKDISDKVLQILEGDLQAFSRRAQKYGLLV